MEIKSSDWSLEMLSNLVSQKGLKVVIDELARVCKRNSEDSYNAKSIDNSTSKNWWSDLGLLESISNKIVN